MIAAIADVLRGCPGAEFEIAGHTDGAGPGGGQPAAQRGRAPRRWSRRSRPQDLPLVDARRRAATARRARSATTRPTTGRARNRRIEFNLGPVPEPEPPEPEAAAAPARRRLPRGGRRDPRRERRSSSRPARPRSPRRAPRWSRRSAQALAGCPDAAFEIGGHTDAQGSESGNLRLSEQRAEAVLAALAADDRPAAGARRPRLRRGRAGRRQRHRGGPGAATAASPSPRVAAERTAAADAGGRPRERAPRPTALARVGAILAGELDPVRARLGDDRAESEPVIDAIARGAARLPGRGARDRRPHRLRGLGRGQPAAEPAARRGGARRARADDLPLAA